MENASKALIIAGAILLSLAIIGIGMYIYTTAQQTIQSANMSQQEITTYNSEFIKYEGTQNGSNVKALLQTIRSHNSVNADELSKCIKVVQNTGDSVAKNEAKAEEAGSDTSSINTILKGIYSGVQYNVTFGYTNSGLIKVIDITKKPTTTTGKK